MKRLIAVLVTIGILFTSLPALGAEFLGNMEVINCNEWVSLRQEPDTGAARIAKVPLGAIVTNCKTTRTDGWVYAEYEDRSGYILAKYLQQCEGVSIHSAMLVMGWADCYEDLRTLETDGAIMPNTIVRNCVEYASGRTYVEYNGRCCYISSENAAPYTELSHYPLQMTLYYSSEFFDEAYIPPALDIGIAYAEDYDLAAYEYTEYDYTEFAPVDEDTPKVNFVLYADYTLKNVHLFSVYIQYDEEKGTEVIEATLENIQYEMDPEHPLAVTAVMYGDMPNLALGYEDDTGVYHFAFVEMSGEDGSLYLNQF